MAANRVRRRPGEMKFRREVLPSAGSRRNLHMQYKFWLYGIVKKHRCAEWVELAAH
jgi:hypothetical protein